MLVKLKATLVRHPLAGFFVLVGAAYVVYAGLAAALSSAHPVLMSHFSSVSVMVAGLAALACCWAISGPSDRPPRRLTQLCIVVAVVLVTMTVLCVKVWLQWRLDQSIFSKSPGLSAGSMPSLGDWIHRELGNTVSWLRALVAGLVLAGAVSPFAAVRRTARDLVSWRGSRVWLLAGLAVLVPVVCLVAATIGGHLAPLAVSDSVTIGHPLGYPLAYFVAALVASVPLVFAWYGFVDRRLAHRVSPLVSGLVIGLALVLPHQLAVRIVLRFWGLNYAWYDLRVLSQIAVAVMAVWLARKARGSLVPTAVLVAAASTGADVGIAWSSPSYGILERTLQLYPVFLIVAAVLFALLGRMWRRTGVPTSLQLPAEADPASSGYDPSADGVGVTL